MMVISMMTTRTHVWRQVRVHRIGFMSQRERRKQKMSFSLFVAFEMLSHKHFFCRRTSQAERNQQERKRKFMTKFSSGPETINQQLLRMPTRTQKSKVWSYNVCNYWLNNKPIPIAIGLLECRNSWMYCAEPVVAGCLHDLRCRQHLEKHILRTPVTDEHVVTDNVFDAFSLKKKAGEDRVCFCFCILCHWFLWTFLLQ